VREGRGDAISLCPIPSIHRGAQGLVNSLGRLKDNPKFGLRRGSTYVHTHLCNRQCVQLLLDERVTIFFFSLKIDPTRSSLRWKWWRRRWPPLIA